MERAARRNLVTVLMPVRNADSTVSGAIESILGQTWEDFDFLIIDDASADCTPAILDRYARKDSRIRVLRHETQAGLAASLNHGMRESDSAWIARMDADDHARPHRLERQVGFVRENPDVSIVGSWLEEVRYPGEPGRIRTAPITHEDIARVVWSCPVYHPTVMFRREAVLGAGGYDERMRRRQDFELWFRCLAAGHRFANIDEVLLEYRVGNDYFEKNDVTVAVKQMLAGWRGCWMVGASPVGYVGVAYPLVRSLLPVSIRRWAVNRMRRLDPRERRPPTGNGERPLRPTLQ